MGRFHFFALLLSGVLISGVLSFQSTNFSIDCETMSTNLTKPEESASPYHLLVSSEEYNPGSEVEVDLEGTSNAGFKWFMLQARDIEKNVPIGSFLTIDPNTQNYDCYNLLNSTLIHKSSDEKYNVTSVWISPEAKKVQFVATVFQDPERYWVVISDKILFPRGSNVTGNDNKAADVAKEASGSPRSRKKSSNIIVRVNCGQGGSYGRGSECAQGSISSSQSSSSHSQGGLIYQGGSIKKVGCLGGGTASVYNKYGCGDGGIDTSGGSSYGQSVSTISDKGKVVVYPPTKPFPPERETYTSQLANSHYKHIQSTNYGEKIQSQGSNPESDIRITIQSGQPMKVCDKTSSSYNSQACKLTIQSSSSQSGGSSVSQGETIIVGGGRPSTSVGGSGTSIIVSEGRPSSVGSSGTSIIVGGGRPSTGSSSTFGSSGSIVSSGSNPCGQGNIPGKNPCKPAGSSSQQGFGSSQSGSSQQGYGSQGGSYSQGNRNPCDGSTIGKIISSSNCPKWVSSGSYGGSSGSSGSQYGQSGSYGSSSSQYGQSGSYGGGSQYGQSGSYGSSNQYGQAGQSGSYGSSSQYGQTGQSGSYGSSSHYGQSGSYGSSSQYGQAGQSGSYGSSSQYGQGSQTSGGSNIKGCGENPRNCRRKRAASASNILKTLINKIRGKRNEPFNSEQRYTNDQDSTLSDDRNNHPQRQCICPNTQNEQVGLDGGSSQSEQGGYGGSYDGNQYGQSGQYGGSNQFGQGGSYGGSSSQGGSHSSGGSGGVVKLGNGDHMTTGLCISCKCAQVAKCLNGNSIDTLRAGGSYSNSSSSSSHYGSQGGSYSSSSSSSGSSHYDNQGESYNSSSQNGKQIGCYCTGGLLDSSNHGQSSQYGDGQDSQSASGQYGHGEGSLNGDTSKYVEHGGSSQYDGQGSQQHGHSQYSGGQGSSYSSNSQYGGRQGSQYGDGQGSSYGGSSQYGEQGSQAGAGQGVSYSSISQYDGQGSQYDGGQGSQHGSTQFAGNGRGKQQSGQAFQSHQSHNSSAVGKQPVLGLVLFSILSAFAVLSSSASKWII
ncbi:hornerin-like [Pantherophis guttatus]|uniref:Hornerin-like n=1 Tax=Pantherophis guttatus TaxID=94885 RepID=A0ABM3ZB15_PANGU|nr:hornerin-like [Pantherophis guttatus]